MSTIVILGDGPLGRAVESAAIDHGHGVRRLGRPVEGRHTDAAFAGADTVVEASRSDAVRSNVDSALAAGVRRFVIATTAWDADHAVVAEHVRLAGASAVAGSNFSIGVVLFGRIVEMAAGLFGRVDGFDPFLVEWHRAGKRDRPSGTARDLARRIAAADPSVVDPGALEVVSIRAGASPGMHLVGFDAPGETVELRLTARDRTAYATGILAAIDWLDRTPRPAGITAFDTVVDHLVSAVEVAA